MRKPKARTTTTRTVIRKVGKGRYADPIPVQPRALSDAQAAALLDVSLRRRDSTAFLRALQLAVKAHRYATVAQKTGFNRTWLYQAISPSGNLGIRTVVTLLTVLGLRLRVERFTKPKDQYAKVET
jgi:probable addiction module antidote protein